jgi:uncharacterized protein YjiS (DUF1127 family)
MPSKLFAPLSINCPARTPAFAMSLIRTLNELWAMYPRSVRLVTRPLLSLTSS